MRLSSLVLAAAVLLAPVANGAFAYENFIPLGQSYSPDDSQLPKLNSERDKFNAQVDIYESDIYTRARAAKAFSSRLEHFSNDQEFTSRNSKFIDY